MACPVGGDRAGESHRFAVEIIRDFDLFSQPQPQEIVAATGCNLQRALGCLLAAHLLQIANRARLASCGLCAPNSLSDTFLIGELSLDAQLRPVRGVLAHLRGAQLRGLRAAIVPDADAHWASLVSGLEVYTASTLQAVVEFLNGVRPLARAPCGEWPAPSYRDRQVERAARLPQIGGRQVHEEAALGPVRSVASLLGVSSSR